MHQRNEHTWHSYNPFVTHIFTASTLFSQKSMPASKHYLQKFRPATTASQYQIRNIYCSMVCGVIRALKRASRSPITAPFLCQRNHTKGHHHPMCHIKLTAALVKPTACITSFISEMPEVLISTIHHQKCSLSMEAVGTTNQQLHKH